jgi:serine protease Do
MRPTKLIFSRLPVLTIGILSLTFGNAIANGQSDDPLAQPAENTAASVQPQISEFETMALTARAFRLAAKRIQPSLVSIESFGGVSAKQGRIGGIRKQGEGNTTGVVVSSDGYILTSTFNFIRQASVVTVTTFDGEKRVAKILGRDDTRKICLLKIDDVTDLAVPTIKPVNQVQVGQWAVSLGVGYGDQTPAISMGIISAKNRIGGRAIQTDANISPANYGGPLVDIQGRLIGICVPMNPQSQAVSAGVEWYDSGIGFAVPVEKFKELIAQLKDGQRILPAFLGVQSIARSDGGGMTIIRVVPESAADKAGLSEKDILLSIDDKPVNDMLRLRQVLNRFHAGQKISIKFETASKSGLDGGQEPDQKLNDKKTVTVQLGSPPTKEKPSDSLEPPKIR